jgi:hypothetical protein
MSLSSYVKEANFRKKLEFIIEYKRWYTGKEAVHTFFPEIKTEI